MTLCEDNTQEFDTRWDEVLSKTPSDDTLGRLYKLKIRESDQLKIAFELHDLEIHRKISVPNYQKLKTMVKRSTDQKLRLNQEQWSRKGLSGVEGGKGFCYQLKEKAKIVRKNQNTLPPHLPSQPFHR